MEYDFIMSIADCIDNVYNYISEDGSRKTVAKLENDNTLSIRFVTILNIARESDLHMQIKNLEKEVSETINSRLKLIKKEFKDNSDRELICKKTNSKDSFETLTVSPYSPMKTIKYNCTCYYEVK
tara:strand:- start:976 stop:1350 length:375 start_codon:yes stop_codon:yes gene_type:complete